MTFSGLFIPSIFLFLLDSGKNLRSNLVLTIFFFFKFLPLSVALSDALPPWFYLLPLRWQFSSVQSFSHIRLFVIPWKAARPSLPVHHQFLESTQTHVHQVGDAIQPSHPLKSPSPALNLSQHQGFSHWVGSLHQVAKVLEFQLQHLSFQWIFRTDFL